MGRVSGTPPLAPMTSGKEVHWKEELAFVLGGPAEPGRAQSVPSATGICIESTEIFHNCHGKQKLLILPSPAEAPSIKMIPGETE